MFFGDTHLTPDDPLRMEVVCRFLEVVCTESTRVYCVGDLFDYWLGPAHARLPDFEPILSGLGRLVDRGVRVEFIHGNRDFLVGSAFSHGLDIPVHERGVSLWVTDADYRMHVCHGDLLCTRDVRYQKMRRVIRSWLVKGMFLALPMGCRARLAQRMRGTSQQEIDAKSPEEMGIVPAAVGRWFDRGFDAVICGHVHREERIAFTGNGPPRSLFTLGDWNEGGGSYLVWEAGEFSFRTFTR